MIAQHWSQYCQQVSPIFELKDLAVANVAQWIAKVSISYVGQNLNGMVSHTLGTSAVNQKLYLRMIPA